ncbi:MAG TPA: hypothetical protein VHP83_09920 [Aggregatilineaceae bacterium]|nr:hypothetical protein [Aggregatilineaceae bacterium]
MRILAIEKEAPNLTAADFAPYSKMEAARAWELYQEGSIRELYFHRDEHIAVLMLECDDVDAAQKVLDTLPLVQAGLITFELMPLVAYPGFARLFG